MATAAATAAPELSKYEADAVRNFTMVRAPPQQQGKTICDEEDGSKAHEKKRREKRKRVKRKKKKRKEKKRKNKKKERKKKER